MSEGALCPWVSGYGTRRKYFTASYSSEDFTASLTWVSTTPSINFLIRYAHAFVASHSLVSEEGKVCMCVNMAECGYIFQNVVRHISRCIRVGFRKVKHLVKSINQIVSWRWQLPGMCPTKLLSSYSLSWEPEISHKLSLHRGRMRYVVMPYL